MHPKTKINTSYNTWLKNIQETDLLLELKSMNDVQKIEAFSQDISFGTGGLRGILGAGSSKMNIITVKKVTLGFINYLNTFQTNKQIKVALAFDPRHKSYQFIELIVYLLANHGIKSYVYSDIKPTPMLSYLVREKQCDGGIMITASHNPKEYNGYKVYNKSGAQLNLEESSNMIQEVDKIDFDFSKDDINLKKFEQEGLLEYISEDFDDVYFESIKNVIKNKNQIKDLNITYSPLHGTGYKIVPKALKFFGFPNVHIVNEQSLPDPDFKNTSSTNPEEIKAYDSALKTAKNNDSDLIIVNDPDADRLGIMFKDKNGDFKFLTGNQTGTLLINYLLKRDNITSGILYKTIVTGDLGSIIAKKSGLKVEETLTGFKFIGDKIKNNKSDNFIFGYEESYGYLINPCVRDKDAIQSSLLIAEMVWFYKTKNLFLDDVLNNIYIKFGYHYEVTNSIILDGIQGMEKIKKIMSYFKETTISNFLEFKVSKKIDYSLGVYDIPKSNVIKFYLENLGWLVFRPSGTEPKLKVYFSIKSDSLEDSKNIINNIYNDILKTINTF